MIINKEFILSCKKVRLTPYLKNESKLCLMRQSYSKSLIFSATNAAIAIANATDAAIYVATDAAIYIATDATFQNK